MRVGLLADTHIPEVQGSLPSELEKVFRDVELILHAGDIYLPSVLDELERIAPVLAAKGDDDNGATILDQRVKEKHILNIGGKTVWLMHEKPFATEYLGQDNRPDIIVFGHEHRSSVQQLNGTLLINPGSPTFLNYIPGPGTVGILDIDAGQANVRIVRL